MVNKVTKKTAGFMTLILSFSLLSNVTAMAQNATVINSSPFRDVQSNHWGIKDMVKLNLRGVVTGYNDGSFQPDKPVTQMEALLMAVRNMNADVSAIDINQPLPFTVPQWVEKDYKKEVLFAISRGLIVPAENSFNPYIPASRAWVAQLVVRMIGKSSEAGTLATQTPQITDASFVPEWAVGYINVGLKYKLVTGYPDNSFKPSKNVSRAELVKLLSRSEGFLVLTDNLLTGQVTAVNGSTLTISVKGTAKTLTVNINSRFFNQTGLPISSTEVKVNAPVTVLVEGTTIKYLEILSAEAAVTTLKGTVLQVADADKVLVIKDDKNIIHTKTLSSLSIIIDPNGKITSLNQLSIGTVVELDINGQDQVISLRIPGSTQTSGNAGFIYSINAGQKLIMIKSATGVLSSYQYTDDASVLIANRRFPNIDDLQAGDEVKYTLSTNLITEIELIRAKQSLSSSGTILLISQEKKIITIQNSNNQLEAYPIADGVTISISGLTTPQLSDILNTDVVDLTIEQGKVTAIKVKDRTYQSFVKGKITAVDTTNRIITITSDSNQLKAFEVSNQAEIIIDNNSSTTSLSGVRKDMQVEIQLVNDKVVYLENKNSLLGTVISLDQSRHIITVKTTTGEVQTFIMESSVDVDMEGVSSPDLDDVSINDMVELRINTNKHVTEINVEKTITYKTLRVDTSSKELRVEDKNQNTRYLALNSRVTLVIPGITSPGISQFNTGDIIKATFAGNRLSKVEVLPATHGQISAVNTYQGTLSIKTFAGTVTSYNFGNSEIVKDGVKITQLSSLTVGDRVEAIQNTNGNYTFNIMKKVTGQFQVLSDSKDKIFISPNPITWNSYSLAPSVYIHNNSQTLTLGGLNKNANLEVYLVGDTVMEIQVN